ncbi:DsbA family oxidoreductase [Mucilaginibacter sp. FT3.2]|uniref:DsbA family oxidoreductase n=1 Tax=Mucilaginibacter sp. FT3.2 TaxID=2723090 RepID=UPI001611BE90|nr:DsbA family oxidoreductase [Mucilaginibacter sp. FT3.2]MBB6232496.1 protein disulfide-isomerase [Mucilaginibacter sp. FT3.2]
MKVEIWSDIMCPHCYIGKRKFEAALAQFPNKEHIEIVWHSFQLNPNLKSQADKDLYTYVAELKGQTREWSVKVHESLVTTAKSLGLDYRFDKAKITNSFDAHRLIQLARHRGLDGALEERFFKAYFSEGAVISDHVTLLRLAEEAGLKKNEVEEVLAGTLYAKDVIKDGEAASILGARGVPFFVFDRKLTLAGAQESTVILTALESAFDSWQASHAMKFSNQ